MTSGGTKGEGWEIVHNLKGDARSFIYTHAVTSRLPSHLGLFGHVCTPKSLANHNTDPLELTRLPKNLIWEEEVRSCQRYPWYKR